MKTLNDIRTAYKLSDPKTVKTKRDLHYSKIPETACTIPAGSEIQLHFSEVEPGKLFFEWNGALRVGFVSLAYKSFTGFSKPPGLKSLEHMVFDGVAKTCCGERTEPDGHGPSGAPSWLLVMGLI